jgi:hypothetical protein
MVAFAAALERFVADNIAVEDTLGAGVLAGDKIVPMGIAYVEHEKHADSAAADADFATVVDSQNDRPQMRQRWCAHIDAAGSVAEHSHSARLLVES